MRSLLLVCNLNPRKLGTFESYVAELGRRCRSDGVRCGVLFSGEPIPPVADELRAAGVEWWAVPGWNDERDRERRRVFIREYLAVLRRGPWDVVVFQFCRETSVSVATLLARVRRSCPAGVWVQHSQMAKPGRVAKWASRLRVLSRFVDGMVVLSDAARDAVVARGWRADRVRVIRNGIPIPKEPRRGWLRPELGLPDSAVLLACVGSLIHRKGHDLLLSAAAPLLGGDPPRHLLIVGDGPEKDRLMAQADALGVGRFVHFLGLRSDVPDLLADSDLFVLASRAEGLTLAVVEAMAAGLPVVVTDVGGHREVVPPAAGHVVPANDVEAFRGAVGLALSDLAAAREKAGGRREQVAWEFSLAKQAEDQYQYFAAVAGRRAGGGGA